MAVHEILLEHLEELESEEMKTFTWHLTQGVEDFSKISKSRLEKKSRCEVVECMIDHYRTDDAAQVTLIILEKMNKNNLAEQLRAKLHVNGHQCTEALQSKFKKPAAAKKPKSAATKKPAAKKSPKKAKKTSSR